MSSNSFSLVTTAVLLAVDIGNTEMSIGLYPSHEGTRGAVARVVRLPSSDRLTADQLHSLLVPHLVDFAPDHISVASVVPRLTGVWEDYAAAYHHGKLTLLHATGIPGVTLDVDRPEEVGVDRVINSWMGARRYGAPLVIVDMGTATTFDVVNVLGAYQGGVIAPGVLLFAESLAQRTARLPRIELKAPSRLVGRNTIDALRSGIVTGHACLVEGLLRRLRDEVGETKVVATGGLMNAVRPALDHLFHAFDATLTLDGIAALSAD